MKKLLNISVIAALAILPLAANANVGDIVSVSDPAHADPATAAETAPGYALAVEAASDTNLATASYVKGAYNSAMKAINKVATTAGNAANQDLSNLSATGKANISAQGTYNSSTNYTAGTVGAAIKGKADSATTLAGYGITDGADTALSNITTAGNDVIKSLAADGDYDNTDSGLQATTIQDAIDEVAETADSAVQGVKVNGTALTEDANGDVNVTIAEGATNGTVAVNGTDVAVHGLGSAAYAATTDFDAAGAASGVQTAIEGKLDDGASGYDIDAKTLKVQGADVLTGASLTDYAKKTGVTQTISNSTISGTVPTVTVWGSETTGTAAITASITGATYAEPAAQQNP